MLQVGVAISTQSSRNTEAVRQIGKFGFHHVACAQLPRGGNGSPQHLEPLGDRLGVFQVRPNMRDRFRQAVDNGGGNVGCRAHWSPARQVLEPALKFCDGHKRPAAHFAGRNALRRDFRVKTGQANIEPARRLARAYREEQIIIVEWFVVQSMLQCGPAPHRVEDVAACLSPALTVGASCWAKRQSIDVRGVAGRQANAGDNKQTFRQKRPTQCRSRLIDQAKVDDDHSG